VTWGWFQGSAMYHMIAKHQIHHSDKVLLQKRTSKTIFQSQCKKISTIFICNSDILICWKSWLSTGSSPSITHHSIHWMILLLLTRISASFSATPLHRRDLIFILRTGSKFKCHGAFFFTPQPKNC
jgi:hypothetical protein